MPPFCPLRPEKAHSRAGTASLLPLPARKGHSVGLNCLPPVTSGPKSPFPGPESPPFCHLRPGMRRAGDGDLQKNGTSPSKQAVFDGGRSFCGTSPSLVAVGLRHSCGHLSHLRDASDIRMQSASDIRVRSASDIRVRLASDIRVRSASDICAVGLRHPCGTSLSFAGHLRHLWRLRTFAARPPFHRSDGRHCTISFFDGNFSLFSLFE